MIGPYKAYWWKAFALLLAISLINSAFAEDTFHYGDVVNKAASLANQSFVPQLQELSPDLQNLDYDLYRRIRFLPERSVWSDLPFRLGFFHPGYNFKRRVLFHAVEKDRIRDIPFSPNYFYYDKPINFAGHEAFVGFNAFVPSTLSGVQDEFLSFRGASYFRAISKGLHWGLSNRGLAINVGLDGHEEFPDFREFWMVKPTSNDDKFHFFALLDSESVTGGYEFTAAYGETTTIDVRATLFFRESPEVVALAPLTSMFYFGGNTVNKPILKPDYQSGSPSAFTMNNFKRREFRPQVHDSDGLLLDTESGEKIWVPLENPRTTRVQRFEHVVSYSLLQRDRNFDDYLDREASYHQRPSATILPKSGFGPGYVRLLQFPTGDEYSDNIVACFEMQKSPGKGSKIEFAYQVRISSAEPDTSQFRVLSTTVRPSPGSNETRFVVEYGKPENAIPLTELHPVIRVDQGGQVKDVQCSPTDRGWLVSFSISNPNAASLDVSCVLLGGETFCSEKWQYLIDP